MPHSNEYIEMLRCVHQDNMRKSWWQIVPEAFYFGLKNKEVPKYYFTRFLYRKSVKNPGDYISTYKLVSKIHRSRKLHNPCIEEILENKLFFSLFLEDKGIPTPKLLGYNLGQTFYAGKEHLKIENHAEMVSFFKEFVFIDGNKEVFIKTIHGSGGGNHYRLSLKDIESNQGLYNKFSRSNFIYQQVISQNPITAQVFAKSINTVRIVSYLDGNEVKLIAGYFRFGSGNSCVDNGCAGGGSVGINLETGELEPVGIQLLDSGGRIFTEHPETHFKFEGFFLPEYSKVKELINKVMAVLPVKIAGWDVAFTTSGPMIIEGNHDFHIGLCEIIAGGYRKNPIIQKILKEV